MNLIAEDVHGYAGDLSSFVLNRLLPRHRWFEFKEGFSAELVRIAISEANSKRPRILDPFSGSGTTVVEAARQGCSATGIEVNPFLVDVARAKCHPWMSDADALVRWREEIQRGRCHLPKTPVQTNGSSIEVSCADIPLCAQ
jgi:SAM-dependent methyltransferase